MFKKILIVVLILFSFWKINYSYTEDNWFLGENRIIKEIDWRDWNWKSLINTISDYIGYLLTFLMILTTIYWIYWWSQIFTAASDDEKVKKGKKIIIQAVIWVILIFLAGPIASFFLWNSDNWETWLLNKTSSWTP